MFRTIHAGTAHLAAALCLLSLSACGQPGGVASAGSSPAPATAISPAATAVAAVADATLPPPSQVSPIAKTAFDDHALSAAWDALDLAASGADTLLILKPELAGTPAARTFADALTGAKTWLAIASKAQRASQADTYTAALEQAEAAIKGAKAALYNLKAR